MQISKFNISIMFFKLKKFINDINMIFTKIANFIILSKVFLNNSKNNPQLKFKLGIF